MFSKKYNRTIMKNNPVLRKRNLLLKNLEKDIQIIKKCLRKDNIDTNNINMVNVFQQEGSGERLFKDKPYTVINRK